MTTIHPALDVRIEQIRATAEARRLEEQRAQEKAARAERARERASESNPEREALARESARVIHERRLEAARKEADAWVRQVGVPTTALSNSQAKDVRGAVRRVLAESTSTLLFAAPAGSLRTMNLLAAYDLIADLHCIPSQVRMRSTRELVSLAQSGFRRAEEEKALVEKGGVVIVDLSGVESLDYRDGEALRETLNLLVAASSRRQITLVLGVTTALSAVAQVLGEGVYNSVLDASPAVVDGMSR